jgi:tetratricopeptide (TPR) repeat protein
LHASYSQLEFRILQKDRRPKKIMKKYSALTLIMAVAVCISQVAQAQGNKEANKLARDGAEASKSQDYNKAVELLRKATALDRKYAADLAVAYQQRGFASANAQKFQDAIADFTEALKINSRDARIYEQRAAVEMKMRNYDKALADYSELIKLKPNEVRYLNYRAYIYEVKDDVQNSMADTEKVLKQDPNNQDAKTRKQRLEQKLAERMPLTPPPRASSPKASPPAAKTP